MGAFVLGLAHGRCVSREWHLPLLFSFAELLVDGSEWNTAIGREDVGEGF